MLGLLAFRKRATTLLGQGAGGQRHGMRALSRGRAVCSVTGAGGLYGSLSARRSRGSEGSDRRHARTRHRRERRWPHRRRPLVAAAGHQDKVTTENEASLRLVHESEEGMAAA